LPDFSAQKARKLRPLKEFLLLFGTSSFVSLSRRAFCPPTFFLLFGLNLETLKTCLFK
jgi:hypothetical protein